MSFPTHLVSRNSHLIMDVTCSVVCAKTIIGGTLCKEEIMESNASGDHYSSCCCWPLMFLYLLRALLDKRELCQLCVCEWVRVLSVQRSFAPT